MIVDQLLRNGLLQFGLFGDVPFKLSLDLLPSYPAVLRSLSQDALTLTDLNSYERLLCPPDALPLALLISQQAAIPLVYSLGSDRPGAFDLVGAYDVGHPTLLVTNIWPIKTDLVPKAERVGLRIRDVLTTVDYGRESALNIYALLYLPDVIAQLKQSGRIPSGQADAVLRWLRVP